MQGRLTYTEGALTILFTLVIALLIVSVIRTVAVNNTINNMERQLDSLKNEKPVIKDTVPYNVDTFYIKDVELIVKRC